MEKSRKNPDFASLQHMQDPCVKEHEMALKCLDESGYDRSKCTDFFTNYRNCRKFWSYIVNARKKEGITPYLPPPEERAEVKKKYLNLMREKM